MEQSGTDDADARLSRRQLSGPLHCAFRRELARFFGWHGLAEYVALDERAAEIAHKLQLFRSLDPFGGGLHLKIGR